MQTINDFNVAGKSKEMFNAITPVKSNTRAAEQACIKDKNGNVLFQRKSIMDRWREYGTKLFERPAGDTPLTEQKIPASE